jgi:hypothetical protein
MFSRNNEMKKSRAGLSSGFFPCAGFRFMRFFNACPGDCASAFKSLLYLAME